MEPSPFDELFTVAEFCALPVGKRRLIALFVRARVSH